MPVLSEHPAAHQQYREVMASVCGPVCVVTTASDGLPHGTTVSAFCALSLDPPMVLVSLDRGSDLLAQIAQTGTFGLNILSSTHSALALKFARKGGAAKFDSVAWALEDGVPRIPGSVDFLVCAVDQLTGGGDHVVIFGSVLRADSAKGLAFTYHQRGFGTHIAFTEASR